MAAAVAVVKARRVDRVLERSILGEWVRYSMFFSRGETPHIRILHLVKLGSTAAVPRLRRKYVASPDCGVAGVRGRTRSMTGTFVVSVECAPSLVKENPRV